jgi:hypothetical protein
MLSNLSTIFLKINNIRSNQHKEVNVNTNTSLLLSPYTKKNINNYIALSNQKSFEIYSKYNTNTNINTNTFSKFSVLNLNKNTNENVNVKKYINSSYFLIGCYCIFLASFSQNILLIV